MKNIFIREGITTGFLFFLLITFSLILVSFPIVDRTVINISFLKDSLFILTFVLLVTVPITFSLVKGKEIFDLDKSKKILYKMPLYSLVSIPLAIIYFLGLLFLIGAGKEGVGGMVWLVLSLLVVLVAAIVSFLFSTYYYYLKSNLRFKKVIRYSVIGIIILEFLYGSFLFATLPNTIICSGHQCLSGFALKNNEIRKCFLSNDQNIAVKCVIQYALAKNDPSVCNKLYTFSYNHLLCFNTVAIESNNPLVCNQITITEDRDKCITKYAFAKLDMSVCNLISSSEKYTCFKAKEKSARE